MKKFILFIAGILINFFFANFSNSTNSTHLYVWKGEIVNEFIESPQKPDLTCFETVDLLEDLNDYVVTECTNVSGATFNMPPIYETDGVVRVCGGPFPCEIRVVTEPLYGLKSVCFFFPE